MRSDLDRIVERIAFWTAMAGGGALIVALVLTVVSIVGRGLISAGLGPIPGDFELVEAGTAFAVLAFMGLCQYHRGHVTVDLFLARAGRRANALVDVLANLLMTAAAGVLTWRLFRSEEHTSELQSLMRIPYAAFCLQKKTTPN